MIYPSIVSRSLIDKGWSGDLKYCVTTSNGQRYLLRFSPEDRAQRREQEFRRMQQVAQLGIAMCLPMEFGHCPEGVYAIHSWVDGSDAEAVIPTLSLQKQYAYGVDAGRMLRLIHSIPAPQETIPWASRFGAKIDRKIASYQACPLQYAGGEAFLRYLAENRQLLEDRPQSYQHGDYHIGNMMISNDGILTVIDFDKDDYGDPWEEFNRIVWSAQAAPSFASGMVDGYFDGLVPVDFWKLLALYISSNTLGSLPWAIAYGDGEVKVMRAQAAQVLAWYDDMKNVVPTWYHKP